MKFSIVLPITLLGASFAIVPSNAADLVLPITFDQRSTPMVSLEIEGVPHQLRLDTGSEEGLHLRRDLLDRIEGVRFTGEMQRSSDMAGNVQENARFVIAELSVYGHTFRDIRGVEFSPWGITVREDSQLPESSVLGLGFFKGQRILIDYLSKELTVFDAASDFDPNRDTSWIEVPFRHSEEGLVLEAVIAGQPHDMVLDTGATISFVVADRIADTVAAVPCQSIYPSLQQEGCRLIAVNTRFGDTAALVHAFLIENEPGNFTATGLLGGDFLQHHAVFVDFAGKRMFVRPDHNQQD
ncbi:hypothetical protein [Phyllobacterium pellucidum]|uniref:hypothetical protein n=1 Tax=Phyllobacterium pellucidum TaxID=2740464 RepID=UPI001D148187|nr:hypothetical protein [Phyllobacterium sp. T1018]UGY10879.1 hypothetical protein LLE51_006870 [Phyllobacterium sp. T1018]